MTADCLAPTASTDSEAPGLHCELSDKRTNVTDRRYQCEGEKECVRSWELLETVGSENPSEAFDSYCKNETR